MDAREQLRQIREQKEELKLKLNDMSTSQASQPEDEHFKGLIERKKVVDLSEVSWRMSAELAGSTRSWRPSTWNGVNRWSGRRNWPAFKTRSG